MATLALDNAHINVKSHLPKHFKTFCSNKEGSRSRGETGKEGKSFVSAETFEMIEAIDLEERLDMHTTKSEMMAIKGSLLYDLGEF